MMFAYGNVNRKKKKLNMTKQLKNIYLKSM